MRIKRGLEAYESDLKIFYEGFVLSDKYSEKMKILDNILYIVDEMKKLSDEIRYKGSDVLIPLSRGYYIKALTYLYLGDMIVSNSLFSKSEELLINNNILPEVVFAAYLYIDNKRTSLEDERKKYSKLSENFGRVHIYKKTDYKISPRDTIILNYKDFNKMKDIKNPNIYGLFYSKQKFEEEADTNFNKLDIYVSLPKGSYEVVELNSKNKLAQFKVKDTNEIKKVMIPSEKRNIFYYLTFKWLF